MTTEEKIEVMQAYERGEKIELRDLDENVDRDWVDVIGEPGWHWGRFEYRVKPKPMEIWVNFYGDGSCCAYLTEAKARSSAFPAEGFVRRTKFVEATEP